MYVFAMLIWKPVDVSGEWVPCSDGVTPHSDQTDDKGKIMYTTATTTTN